MFPRLLVVAFAVAIVTGHATAGGLWSHYERVFCFGDSLTDTGNGAILPATAGGPFTLPPYGETYFGHPSGRASDGRLIIDFIVDALGVPEPTPYLAGKTAADFQRGVNYALGGATALDTAFFERMGVTTRPMPPALLGYRRVMATAVPASLSNETIWFKDTLQLLAGSSAHEKRKIMESSLFYFGEMGVNDYFQIFFSNGSVDLAKRLVPHIISAVHSALTTVIATGARTVVVTGMIPLGCEPVLLTLFPGGVGDYDRATGCIKRFNELAQLHNRELKLMLRELRGAHPSVSLLYADIYRPLAVAVASPAKYGFGDKPLTAYCGGGEGPYHFDFTAFCAMPGSAECSNHSVTEFISWDGIHFTEAANRFLAGAMLRELYKVVYTGEMTAAI